MVQGPLSQTQYINTMLTMNICCYLSTIEMKFNSLRVKTHTLIELELTSG